MRIKLKEHKYLKFKKIASQTFSRTELFRREKKVRGGNKFGSWRIRCANCMQIKATWLYIWQEIFLYTCGWNVCKVWALCNGISTRFKNNLCSSLSGIAKPFIILQIDRNDILSGLNNKSFFFFMLLLLMQTFQGFPEVQQYRWISPLRTQNARICCWFVYVWTLVDPEIFRIFDAIWFWVGRVRVGLHCQTIPISFEEQNAF